LVRALPQIKYKKRIFTIDRRLGEARSIEFGKKPIFLRGQKASKIWKKK
jgi:hypothetical protein